MSYSNYASTWNILVNTQNVNNNKTNNFELCIPLKTQRCTPNFCFLLEMSYCSIVNIKNGDTIVNHNRDHASLKQDSISLFSLQITLRSSKWPTSSSLIFFNQYYQMPFCKPTCASYMILFARNHSNDLQIKTNFLLR